MTETSDMLSGPFFAPPLLFRQNATLHTPHNLRQPLTAPKHSWFADRFIQDCETINATCQPGRQTKISSNYWKVPDNSLYLTAVSAHPTDPFVAVASGNSAANLFVYELDPLGSFLTHHHTITIPKIHSLSWLPNGAVKGLHNLVATGHHDGTAHLIMLPDPQSEQPAEIFKRFNHSRHLNGAGNTLGGSLATSDLRIRALEAAPQSWTSCAPASLLTLCAESFFLWDPTRSDVPVLQTGIPGTTRFSAGSSAATDGRVALAGDYGVSLRDLRAPEAAFLVPKIGAKAATHVTWSPAAEHVIASAHTDSSVRVWDVRMAGCVAELRGHSEAVTALQWGAAADELYSAAYDGNIVHWDLAGVLGRRSGTVIGKLKEGLEAIGGVRGSGGEIQKCGSVIPASRSSVVALASFPGGKTKGRGRAELLSVDGAAFLGLHCKSGGFPEEPDVLQETNVAQETGKRLSVGSAQSAESSESSAHSDMSQSSQSTEQSEIFDSLRSPESIGFYQHPASSFSFDSCKLADAEFQGKLFYSFGEPAKPNDRSDRSFSSVTEATTPDMEFQLSPGMPQPHFLAKKESIDSLFSTPSRQFSESTVGSSEECLGISEATETTEVIKKPQELGYESESEEMVNVRLALAEFQRTATLKMKNRPAERSAEPEVDDGDDLDFLGVSKVRSRKREVNMKKKFTFEQGSTPALRV